VRIDLVGRSDGVHLTIQDEGIGFEPRISGGKAGLGFVSMQERLRLVNGFLNVRSAPGQGTRIDAWVPFPTVQARTPARENTPEPALDSQETSN
jgi:signal transduction histidine kinase